MQVTTRQWRIARLDPQLGLAGLVGMLPDIARPCDDEYCIEPHVSVVDLAHISVFLDLARQRPRSEEIVLEVRAEERALVAESLGELIGRAASRAEVDAVSCVLDGLRRRLIDVHAPMPLPEAIECLQRVVDSLRTSAGAVAA
ncbi:hypothetical protein D9V37_11555 [Nocardioides mangrovicus]|uniref:Uncharacterized protein n=1 Tax=Nocardioides mangrovicus TaxID=2478913 RepID=A0A3L8P164_9ACTN|nr:hypothetical protein [Nocardioides mangrovicus]RLV49186.1 hypothetical protein D9V37_11555 [Nocardioides mangrovicus]